MDPEPPGQMDGESEATEAASTLNPMLLPHVLAGVFGNSSLSKEELVVMREVCREWRIEATKAYSNQFEMHLECGESMSVTKMYVALDLVQEPYANLPLPTKLHVDSAFFCQHRKMLNNVQRYFESFLELLAPELDEIVFNLNLPTDANLEFVSYQSNITFPKLKKCLYYMNEVLPQCQEYMVQVCAAVLGNSPALETVKICTYLDHASAPDSTETEQMLDDKLVRVIPSSVRKIYLFKRLQVTTTRILGGLALPNLEVLELETRDSYEVGHADFCRIFNGCRENLKEFTILRYLGGVEFPSLPRLQELTLGAGLYNSPLPEPAHALHPFTTLFPAVTQLRLADMGSIQMLNTFFPKGFNAPQVSYCSFPEIVASPETTLNLALGFSAVKRITLSPPRALKTLPIIFANMNGLEELYIRFRGTMKRTCLDSALTGIPRNVCRSIRENKTWDVQLDSVKTGPGLSDLTNLKSLRMHRLISKRLFITDVTGYFGILKNENLTDLTTCRFEMNQDCVDKLTARFGDKSVVDPSAFAVPAEMIKSSHAHYDFNDSEDESDSDFQVKGYGDDDEEDDDASYIDYSDGEMMDDIMFDNYDDDY